MSRKIRTIRKKYLVFCEGDTEYNYINGMRVLQSVKSDIALKPVPLDHGGYTSFLKKIKECADSNCIAKFILIDYDRVIQHGGEKKCLSELIDYCKIQNKKNNIPHFVILSNPNYDYFSCLHSLLYRNGNIESFITSDRGFNFRNMAEYKAKGDIYNFLNSNGNSVDNALNKLKNKNSVIINTYHKNAKSFSIKIKDTNVCYENDSCKGSNINEFFDIVEW